MPADRRYFWRGVSRLGSGRPGKGSPQSVFGMTGKPSALRNPVSGASFIVVIVVILPDPVLDQNDSPHEVVPHFLTQPLFFRHGFDWVVLLPSSLRILKMGRL